MSHKIVFLYEDEYVPPEILRVVEQRLSSGFELTLVEARDPSRLEAVSSADFIIGYPADLSLKS